jgi:hypothetical protein
MICRHGPDHFSAKISKRSLLSTSADNRPVQTTGRLRHLRDQLAANWIA